MKPALMCCLFCCLCSSWLCAPPNRRFHSFLIASKAAGNYDRHTHTHTTHLRVARQVVFCSYAMFDVLESNLLNFSCGSIVLVCMCALAPVACTKQPYNQIMTTIFCVEFFRVSLDCFRIRMS